MTRTESDDRLETPWHSKDAQEVLTTLGSRESGLTNEEVVGARARYGPNRLADVVPPGWWRFFLHQFMSPLIFVLLAAAAVSLALGEYVDFWFIIGVLLINATVGTFQEWRADRSSRALKAILKARATVLRNDETYDIDAADLVPGDVVWLESGNRVPADLRLLAAQSLEIDESLLTGESLPVSKDAARLEVANVVVADRKNIAHGGSIVARGRGRGVVVATGPRSLIGRVAEGVTSVEGGRPPLVVRMERFARAIGVAVLTAASLVAAIGVLAQGQALSDMFLFAVALAVSAIPEGLPIAMTVALTVATRRMLGRGVIVRKLTAVEGLGSCTLIASDKTGTLTCNEITARRLVAPAGEAWDITGEGYSPVGQVTAHGAPIEAPSPALLRCARVAALCNEGHLGRTDEGWTWRGDPTDVALLAFAHKCDVVRETTLTATPEIARIPFEPDRRFAASYHQGGDGAFIVVKGAPERVIEMCRVRDAAAMLDAATAMAAQGFRVLALAEGRVVADEVKSVSAPPDPGDLELCGLIGLIDPPRPGVVEAIRRCQDAGIGVAMITGDHPVTALSIARELGFAASDADVVSGAELVGATPERLEEWVRGKSVFARVSPQQKLDIVNAARRAGHFVAVTGDGINDGPALRAANIGVAMGRGGTDVAREAAELVLIDDNFATIVAGVEEGRIAYENVRKVIYLLVSTGASEVILVALSLTAGLPLPLLPVQLLWLNLVTNGIQDVALAFEPGEEGILSRPPRKPTERIFDRLMVERTLIGAFVIGTVAFVVFASLLRAGRDEGEARNILFLLMVLFENVHIGNCRSETRSIFGLPPWRSPILLGGTLTAFLVHLIAMHTPGIRDMLRAGPVDGETWVWLLATTLSVTIAMELHKLWWNARARKAGPA